MMSVIMFLLFVMFVLFCAGCFATVLGFKQMSPEERKKAVQVMGKALADTGEKVNSDIRKWQDERREIRSAKRARNTALWEIGKKFFDR